MRPSLRNGMVCKLRNWPWQGGWDTCDSLAAAFHPKGANWSQRASKSIAVGCIQCERKVPAEQPLAVRQSYQAVRCPQAEKRTSCFSCMGCQESPACLSCIAGQRRADRKECILICSHLKKGCSRHACFCKLTLLVLTDFLLCVSSPLWCVPSFRVFIFALSLGCCST